MDKKDKFKSFISNHPELINYIKNKEMTFQDFYEIYDIYGEDDNTWNKYFSNKETTNKSEIKDIIKNVNLDSIGKHVDNAQKVVGIIQELTKKSEVSNVLNVTRPIGKFFGD